MYVCIKFNEIILENRPLGWFLKHVFIGFMSEDDEENWKLRGKTIWQSLHREVAVVSAPACPIYKLKIDSLSKSLFWSTFRKTNASTGEVQSALLQGDPPPTLGPSQTHCGNWCSH